MITKLIANSFVEKAEMIARLVVDRQLKVATAESCTGGGIAAVLTAVPGSSLWFECGIVCYSNESKANLLGVPAETITRFGAVSCEVVECMAKSIADLAGVDIAISVSGIAGPSGGTSIKPVGTIWIGWYILGELASTMHCFSGDRDQIRSLTVEAALNGLSEKLKIKTV